ncbi:hypothetical protein TNCV_4018681 [Trichonephila clavipes]|nr:hypothetical protein TNCV_4018681 [Trichonephila clavipes]
MTQVFQLLKLGNDTSPYKVIPVDGDSSCLFSSISYLLYGNVQSSFVVRQAVVDYIISNWDRFKRFVEWAQNQIAVVPDFHKRILFSDKAHFWLNGYVNKQNCRIWSEANPQVYVETPLHPEKTVWCALWAGGILLQKR